uniref:Cation-independent mannose-6-phosphate receptor-like n=1 Tax=Saccoglossus kowalevskii TaxID=10224 RepID=A0ABM0MDV5_SACKO|nr:PREDICTED: cation-independent mannose-6-phosphate receptor-like [Saccoglossus kowalevskii]
MMTGGVRGFYRKLLSCMCLVLYFVQYSTVAVNAECKIGGFDLETLNQWTWEVRAADWNNIVSIYHINICKKFGTTESTAGCQDSIVCEEKDNVFTNIGNYTETLANSIESSGGLRVDYKGIVCPIKVVTGGIYTGPEDEPEDEIEYLQTTINFRCGKTLGSPEFVGKFGCTYFFDWYTSAVCKSLSTEAKSEVPCYVYDANNKKRDLNPLIKTTGGYLIDTEGEESFFINVCRDINPQTGGATQNCHESAAACLIKGDTAYDMGVPSMGRLEIIDDNTLKLHYEATVTPALAECNGVKPKVIMRFVCPKDEGIRGGGKDPMMLSSINCQYEIEWFTEYACEEEYSVSSTCQLTQDTHGIDIDLSLLQKPSESEDKYIAEGKGWDDKMYRYYLDVCKNTDIECDGDHARDPAVWQTSEDSNWCTVAGSNKDRILRFSDGELTLIYRHGDQCSHNGLERSSFISFKCNAASGIGEPKFVTEEECSYFFEWETKHACRDHARDSNCHVTSSDGKQQFDLSTLVKTEGSNWEALQHDESDERYFLNVCGDILSSDPFTTNCPPGSAGCKIGTDTGAQSLGKYSSSLIIEGGNLKLTYSEGSPCVDTDSSIHMETTITFVCSPGDLESGPTLIRKNKCLYEFEWHTAAACPLGKRKGDHCKVVDDEAGFSFDLSNLKKEDNYKVTYSMYDYYINVCKEVTGTGATNCDGTAGACQKQTTGDNAWITGLPSSELEYYDGVIRLTYSNGDPYRTTNNGQINRQTQIAFLCKPDAGNGTPEFIGEGNYTYSFRWYTKYACPQIPIECTVTDPDTHKQYDLSSLSKAEEDENWSVIDPYTIQKYYINVCRSINPVAGCSTYAAACQTQINSQFKEVIGIPNMGIASSRPTIESSESILLEYTDGQDCTDVDNKIVKTAIRIHFICTPGNLESVPRFVEKIGNCQYSFMWNTEAACAIDDTKGEECAVKDPNSEYTFNLQPLKRKTYYTVTTEEQPSQTFKINICDNVISSECSGSSAACLLDNGKWKSIASKSTSPEFSDDGQLTLKYEGVRDVNSGQFVNVVITFLCRTSIQLGEPKFVRKEGITYLFDFETALACRPQSVDCLVYDSHANQYDLSSLSRESGNWEAVDTRVGYEHLRYHINVCRPLNSAPNGDYICPGGPIGGCQTSDNDPKQNFNLGYIQAMPEAGIDGSLSIQYLNGDQCHGKYHRSTRINFECSTIQGSPVFQDETPECEYVFTWETPSACKLQQNIGSECKVKDPRYGIEFDLSPLRNEAHDYHVTVGGYTYLVNVCGALKEGSGVCTGEVGSCQLLENGTPVDAGKYNQELKYDNGMLALNYTTGQKCHSDIYERATLLQFTCDEEVEGTNVSSISFFKETDDCTYVFSWRTRYACPPSKIVECSYRDQDGEQYDLTPLSEMTHNYVVIPTIPGYKKEIYYINVCRSLKSEQDINCPVNAAACLEYETDDGTKKWESLGTVSGEPFMVNGQLQLHYELGDTCPGNPDKKKSAFITFSCQEDRLESSPEFSYAVENCEYYFFWITKSACKLNHQEVVTNDCTVENPESGLVFDLNVLKKDEGYKVLNTEHGHLFDINICAPLKTSQCTGSNVGSCQSQVGINSGQAINAGIYNRKLFYNDGIISLNYSNGDPCPDNKYHRNSIFSFICNQDGDIGNLGVPVYLDDTDECTYYFSWHTPLVCENYIQCSVVKYGIEDLFIDLTPLITENGGYLAVSSLGDVPASDLKSSDTYYINLCRPLNPIAGAKCPPGSSACRVREGEAPISLGKAAEEPYITAEDEVAIKYVHGSKCPQDEKKQLSMLITFHCKPGISETAPSVFGYANCTYLVEWDTDVVCPKSKPAPATSACTYYDSALDYTFDLSPLVVLDDDGVEYDINICAPVPGAKGSCENAGVCKHHGTNNYGVSLGSASHQEFMYDSELKLMYSKGDGCPGVVSEEDVLQTTTIIFECDETIGHGKPELFLLGGICEYVFKWKTSLACPPSSEPCVTAYNGKIYDLQVLSRATGHWEVKDKDNVYFINLCQPVSEAKCPEGSAICVRKSDGSYESLGLAKTQHMKGIVEITNIELQCSTTVGKGPVIRSADSESCNFYFEWQSRVACSIEKEFVQMHDEKVTDPVSNGVIDLSPLIDKGLYTVDGDIRLNGKLEQYVYLINLKKDGLDSVEGDTDGKCKGAAICQYKKDSNSMYRNIGMASPKSLTMEADILEIVVTNLGTCHKDNIDDVTSTIVFYCDNEADPSQLGVPEFQYESMNCQYFFNWHTPAVCVQAQLESSISNRLSATVKDNPGTVGIVILIVLLSITICILLIVFHKPERRSAFARKVRGCCCPGYTVPSYKYSKLADNDVESDLLMNIPEREYDDDSEEEPANPVEVVASAPEPKPKTKKDKKSKREKPDEKDKKKKKKSKTKKDEPLLDMDVDIKNGPFKGKSIAYHDDSDEDMLNI